MNSHNSFILAALPIFRNALVLSLLFLFAATVSECRAQKATLRQSADPVKSATNLKSIDAKNTTSPQATSRNINPVKPAPVVGGGRSGGADDGNSAPPPPAPNSYTSPVVGKYLFYGGSGFASASDNDAIAPDKTAFDDGDSATFNSYSSYVHGINGIFIDIQSINGTVDVDDFEFRVGDDDSPEDWTLAPAPTITTDVGGGVNGSDRVKLVWVDGTILNTWLQVRIRGNTTTRVADDEVFYFGSAVCEVLNSATDARVNLVDVGLTRSNQTGFGSAPIDSPYDFDRDGRINLVDVGLCRANQTGFSSLPLITPVTPALIDLAELGFRRGVNFGNMLEAPNEGDWGLFVEERFFNRVVEGGFDHIRLPITWTTHTATTPPYTIDPVYLDRVDWCIEQALDRGLKMIVNVHHYGELNADPVAETPRALAIWNQIATRYRDEPGTIFFEVLNEPHDVFSTDAQLWNDYFDAALQVIRNTNPVRKVLVGPINYNSIDSLPTLDPPADDNLIASVHYYEPFLFTHQGASWIDPPPPVGVDWINNRLGFGSNWQSWSWNTTLTPKIGALGVEYTAGWAGLRFHGNAPVSDVDSFSFTVNQPMTLNISWRDAGDVELGTQVVNTTSGTNEYTVNFGAPVTIGDIVIQNLTPDPVGEYDLTTAQLNGTSGSLSLLQTEEEAINSSFAFAALWSQTFGIPIHLGEFGAYEPGDLPSRVRWTTTVREAAEANNIPFSYWEFGAGFGIFDPANDQWRLQLLQSLIPEFVN